MKKAVVILFFTLFAASTNAQTDTVWHLLTQNVPQGPISMIWSSVDTGFFMLPNNVIARTPDSGVTFTNLKFPVYTLTHVDSPGHSHLVHDHNKEIGQVADMAWPTRTIGYVIGQTNGDDTMRGPRSTILATTDGGDTWTQYYAQDTSLAMARVYFSSPQTGWATGSTTGDQKFLAKTTDGGKDWTVLDRSTSVVYSPVPSSNPMSFKDDQHGLILVQSASDNTLHVMYTYDGWAHSKTSPSLGDSAPQFAYWLNDSTWVVGTNGLQLTTDSGRTWKTVLADNLNGGHIAAGAFRDSVGFVTRDIYSTTFRTTDWGQTWTEFKLADSVAPFAPPDNFGVHLLSMPTNNRLYFLGQDPVSSAFEVMKITVPGAKTQNGGGGVAMTPQTPDGLSLSVEGNMLRFTTKADIHPRSLEILDLVGRTCARVEVPSMSTSAQCSSVALPAGSYFARLGEQTVKFVIW